MFHQKFSYKNLIKLKSFLMTSKFAFARRVSNPNSKSQTPNLFDKFTIETEQKQKKDNHF